MEAPDNRPNITFQFGIKRTLIQNLLLSINRYQNSFSDLYSGFCVGHKA